MAADMKGTCETCGAEDVDLYVYALPGIPYTAGNCLICMQWSCYPWVLVGNTVAIGGLEHAADWWKFEVRVTCARLGKTMQEFDAAVKQALEEERALDA